MRRLRHRRRAARYCLWGHHGNLVQVGSAEDRCRQRRLGRRAGFVRAMRRLNVAAIRADESMRKLVAACEVISGAAPESFGVTSGYRQP